MIIPLQEAVFEAVDFQGVQDLLHIGFEQLEPGAHLSDVSGPEGTHRMDEGEVCLTLQPTTTQAICGPVCIGDCMYS